MKIPLSSGWALKSNGNIEFWEYDKNNFEKFKLLFRDYIHDENENAIYKKFDQIEDLNEILYYLKWYY